MQRRGNKQRNGNKPWKCGTPGKLKNGGSPLPKPAAPAGLSDSAVYLPVEIVKPTDPLNPLLYVTIHGSYGLMCSTSIVGGDACDFTSSAKSIPVLRSEAIAEATAEAPNLVVSRNGGTRSGGIRPQPRPGRD